MRSGYRPGARPRPARAVGGGRGCHGSGRTGAAGGRGGCRGTGRFRPPARASVVRAFDGRRGSMPSPRLSEGSATRAQGVACGGPGGGGLRALPLGVGRTQKGSAPRSEPTPKAEYDCARKISSRRHAEGLIRYRVLIIQSQDACPDICAGGKVRGRNLRMCGAGAHESRQEVLIDIVVNERRSAIARGTNRSPRVVQNG